MNFLDIKDTIDFVKLRLYNEYLYQQHMYDEGESELHKTLTPQIIKTYIDPLNLNKNSMILDLGCGPGYFLDEMKNRGYNNLVGVTLSDNDAKTCQDKGHIIKKLDISFLPQNQGFLDESVDFIFLRHALEHSPYPIISLIEYNRILKQNSYMYIEVPAPDTERMLEFNPNHYSILGAAQLSALLVRTGFKIEIFNNFEFELTVPTPEQPDKKYAEKYYCILVKKAMALDIK